MKEEGSRGRSRIIFFPIKVLTPRFLILQSILSYRLKDLINCFSKMTKVLPTDHNQVNNLMSQIICF